MSCLSFYFCCVEFSTERIKDRHLCWSFEKLTPNEFGEVGQAVLDVIRAQARKHFQTACSR